MSVWGRAASAVLGGVADGRKQREDADAKQQEREMAQFKHAQMLAALSEQGYGMGDAPAETPTFSGGTVGADGTMAPITPQAKRYEQIVPGKTGIYRDTTRTPDAKARRAKAEADVAKRAAERERAQLIARAMTGDQNARAQLIAAQPDLTDNALFPKPQAQQHVVDPVTGDVKFYDPTNPPPNLHVNPQPRDAFAFPVVAGEDGKSVVARANTRTGAIDRTDIAAPARAPAGRGSATIKRAVAANQQQLSIIADAIKELDAHPDAVGLTRGLPYIGDRIDPRADTKGVGARASIANVGSLLIHDRSGAAVSVHEFPRLAPFVPSISDPPEAIKIKLGKLRAAIIEETNALQGDTDLHEKAHVTPAERAALKHQGFTDAQIDAITP